MADDKIENLFEQEQGSELPPLPAYSRSEQRGMLLEAAAQAEMFERVSVDLKEQVIQVLVKDGGLDTAALLELRGSLRVVRMMQKSSRDHLWTLQNQSN